jgi:hypothetical protein
LGRLVVAAVALALGACDSTPPTTAPADADHGLPDVAVCAAFTGDIIDGCAPGELATVTLDGAWTLTGTQQQFPQPEMPYTTVLYLKQTGTGPCAFGLASEQPVTDLPAYVDATRAFFSTHRSYPQSYDESWQLCVRASDGALAYFKRIIAVGGTGEITSGVLAR